MALDQLPRVRSAHERMDRIIDDVLALARGGTDVDERPVNVGNVASEAAGTVETTDANVDVACDRVVLADRSSLKRLLENLLRNAAEHGGSQIRVGELPADGDATAAADADATAGDATAAADADATAGDATAAADADGTAGDATSAPGGFYVADDGPGIDESERASVLDAGVSMEDGTGLGLAIVRDIADAHGWCVSVETDPELGGARIAVRDVERA